MAAVPERMVDDLAAASRPEDVDQVDRQFADKLERLEDEGAMKAESLRQLRALWGLLKRTDDEVPWRARALAMAALAYFVAPFDAVPDVAGKLGYKDDELIIGICYRRVTKVLGVAPTEI